MWEGPKETLTLTENAQPALMAVSMAVMRVLEREKGFKLADKVKFVAGHSLGRIFGACRGRRLQLADAARLLKLRGQAMQEAVPVGQGAMAALLGVGMDVAAQGRRGRRAGRRLPGRQRQRADAGRAVRRTRRRIDRVPRARQGARRAPRHAAASVSAPFHCALMQPAADAMAEALAQGRRSRRRSVPVVANVLAAPISDPAEIKKRLVEQVTGTVRWRECVAVHGGQRRHRRLRDRLRQGAGRPRQAHRRRRSMPRAIGTPPTSTRRLPRLNA